MSENKESVSTGKKIAFNTVGILATAAMGVIFSFKCNTDEQVKQWKKEKDGFVILSEHPSKLDAAILTAAAFPRYTRFVTGAQHLNSSIQGSLLRYIGVIPKKQFMPDLKAMKEMLKTVKSGNVLGMMPEGRISMDGTQNLIDISTAKLIKALECNVAVLIPHGSYFVKPPYRYNSLIPGPVSCDLKVAITKEDVQKLDAEEILVRLQDSLSYDTMADLKERGSKFGDLINPCFKDVSKLFYLCPSCKKLYTMRDDGRKLWCDSCSMTLGLGRDPFFITQNRKQPKDITAWNKKQINFEKKYWKNDDAILEFDVLKGTIILGEGTDFEDKEKGKLTLSKEGLHYIDSEEELTVPINQLPAVAADYQEGYIVYYQGQIIRRFKFDDVRMTPRFVNSLAILTNSK